MKYLLAPIALLLLAVAGCKSASDVSASDVKAKEAEIQAATKKLDPNVDMSGRTQGH